jgi:hypothetical protein
MFEDDYFIFNNIGNIMHNESINNSLNNEINNYLYEISELHSEIKILENKNIELNKNLSNNYFCFNFTNNLDYKKIEYNKITINYLQEQILQIEYKISKIYIIKN